MAIIDPIALATEGKVAPGGTIEPIALATMGVITVAGAAPPAALPGVWRMWTGGIGIDMYGRYDRG